MIVHTAVSISNILTNVGSFVTSAITWVGDFAGAVTSNELILCFVIVSFVGLGVGLLRRLIRL